MSHDVVVVVAPRTEAVGNTADAAMHDTAQRPQNVEAAVVGSGGDTALVAVPYIAAVAVAVAAGDTAAGAAAAVLVVAAAVH